MEELKINVSQQTGVITANFDEIKEALKVQMTAYTDLEITEDGIKDAKADLATLRKIRKAFDDRRKEVKTEFMKPYNDFEAEAKELLKIIDEPIGLIDSKLKEFEEKRIAEKQAHLHELYEQNIGELSEFLPYERVATAKWTNITCSDKDVLSDISEAKTTLLSDLNSIKALSSEIEDKLIEAYKQSDNNLAAAIKRHTDFIAAKSLAEQRVKEEQKRKEREEQECKAKEEAEHKAEESEKWVETVAEDLAVANEQVVGFVISGKGNIEKARMILNLEEIPYKEI